MPQVTSKRSASRDRAASSSRTLPLPCARTGSGGGVMSSVASMRRGRDATPAARLADRLPLAEQPARPRRQAVVADRRVAFEFDRDLVGGDRQAQQPQRGGAQAAVLRLDVIAPAEGRPQP